MNIIFISIIPFILIITYKFQFFSTFHLKIIFINDKNHHLYIKT